MLKMEYMDQSFNIQNNPCFNNIDGLKDISDYLDFAIFSTIHKQIPNVTEQKEKELAAILLKNFMLGDARAFTSQYNIRNNIKIIGFEKIKYLLVKTLIEKDEINKRILHKLVPQDYYDECATFLTNVAYSGSLEQQDSWISVNIPVFIDVYVEEMYGKNIEDKAQREQLSYENSITSKALDNLNLEMSLNRLKN